MEELPKPLLTPHDGVPDPIDTPAALAEAIEIMAQGTGPIAVDAERASGYRYSQRAYLIQLRRAGVGTLLIDPLPFEDLCALGEVMDAEWIIHAASQDLPSLNELGLNPKKLFDTELAGRLAGFPKVGLASMVSELLGYELKKTHSAVDWSTRPLPLGWLSYAALDVELLIDLRHVLEAELRKQNKLDWALEEFAALAHAAPPKRRSEPWRRTSGIHQVRTARGLARVRALWEARDELAQRRDVAAGRVLPDSAIVSAAQADPSDEGDLLAIAAFAGRGTRRHARLWLEALSRARALPERDLPGPAAPSDGPPPAHRWADRDPVAAARLTRARSAIAELASAHNLPAENVLTPEVVRRMAWSPPPAINTQNVSAALTTLGARGWQIELTVLALTEALADPPAE